MALSNKDHPAYGSVLRIIELQSDAAFAATAVAENEQYALARDKVFAIARYLRDLLEHTPSQLTSASALSQLQNNLAPPLSEISSFAANGNPQHLVSAAAQLDANVMPLQWGFSSPAALSGKGTGDLLEGQAAASQATFRQLASQRDEFAAKIQELSVKVSDQIAQIEASAQAVAQTKADAAATIAQLELQFAEREKERVDKSSATVSKLTEDFTEFDRDRRAEAQQLVSKLIGHVAEARKLVQIVGNDTVTGHYQKVAKSEEETADFWRNATIGFFGLGLVVASVTFVKFLIEPFSADSASAAIIRMLYAIVITTPAWYTARESARHRTNSDRARQTELELASLGPFIELLSDDKKREIREKMTGLYFGKGIEAHTATSPLDTLKSLADTAMEMMKAAKK